LQAEVNYVEEQFQFKLQASPNRMAAGNSKVKSSVYLSFKYRGGFLLLPIFNWCIQPLKIILN